MFKKPAGTLTKSLTTILDNFDNYYGLLAEEIDDPLMDYDIIYNYDYDKSLISTYYITKYK